MNLDNKLEFKAWPKIPRLNKEKITITEKMDGTNSSIIIKEGEIVGIQSRKRFIYPEGYNNLNNCDNAGFAGWVRDNEKELLELGEGHHFGEWVGPSIQKNPHNLPIKRFYLFNTHRWGTYGERCPSCCTTVRELYNGDNTKEAVTQAMENLLNIGAMEEYTPEGIIVFNHLAKAYYKLTYECKDGKWDV